MWVGLFKENGERYTSLALGVHFNSEEEKLQAIEKVREEAKENGYEGILIATELTEEQQEYYLSHNLFK